MTKTKINYRSMFTDLNCNFCDAGVPQSDSHLLDCTKIIEDCSALSNNNSVEYEDIFGTEQQQIEAIRVFMKVFETKAKLEEENQVNSNL